MSARIYIEGGGDSKGLHSRCREGFRKLFEKCGFRLRMPKLFASGSRGQAFKDFRTAHGQSQSADYVALLIDSETRLKSVEATWEHLAASDDWTRPPEACDDQVLFMTTCMETWIVADRKALADHYGHALQESGLPALADLEASPRNTVQESLAHATRACSNAYGKGKRSFAILAELDPGVLEGRLPSFHRARRILDGRL